MKKLFALVLCIGLTTHASLFAQNGSNPALNATIQYLQTNLDQLDLTSNDIQDYVITDQYTSSHNNATHIYLRQRYQGTEIYNAVFNATLNSEYQVTFTGNRFVKNIASKVNATTPSLTPIQAVEKAADALDIARNQPLQLLQTVDSRNYTVAKSDISLEVIPVKLMYLSTKEGELKLVWDLSIYTVDAQHWWSVRVDAATGDLLDRHDWVIQCNPKNLIYTNQSRKQRMAIHDDCTNHTHALPNLSMTGSYNVFAMPLESPIHGNRTLEVNPSNTSASPFGWHDTDGAMGAEYTITRGNNVHAYSDSGNNNSSVGDEPDGGSNLVFDFPLDLNLEPFDYKEAAVTNLFYWNNIIHDVWYQYGFDSQSGNFQENTYGLGGFGNDAVQAEAQDGFDTNNANFATPPDGLSGRMQMFRWNSSNDLFNVNDGTAQGGYEVEPASFGPALDTIGITGQLIIVDDGTLSASEGCNPLINGSQLSGNIAIIDRGSCEFGLKVLNAQNAGAIGAIVCNNQPTPLISMAAGSVGGQVTIPAVFLSQTDCNTIKVSLQSQNVQATLALPAQTGPDFIDADLDNGVIVHEYGHGISTRLAGGPGNSNCLDNAEQQGEGWSDWFALVMTVEPGDVGTDVRGMGVYVAGQDITGRGIRSAPYTTDMSIDPKTLKSTIIESVPHGVGSVFASMIWDMYWGLVAVHGYDNDIYNGTGGNNIAMQLVIDGLKMQACNPSFTDVRDAILAADMMTYNGANQCIIWEAFANRGLGANASAGDPNNQFDFVEDFSLPLSCTNELFVKKTAPSEITGGEDITYTIEITNLTSDTLNNVTINDTLVSNLTYVTGSSSCTVNSSSNGVVSLNVGTMLPNDVVTCTFDATVATAPFSNVIFVDSVEDATTSANDWLPTVDQGGTLWVRDQLNPRSGSWSWYASTPAIQSDFALTTAPQYTITGTKPALRFFHDFDITEGIEAGVVEASTDFTTWADIGQYAIKGGYAGPVLTTDLTLAPGRSGFYGKSNGYQETIIDLSSFIGQTLYFRFRVATDDAPTGNIGWYIDDISIIDLALTPNSATATSGTWTASGEVEGGGTIVFAGTVSTNEQRPTIPASIFPNPTSKNVQIQMGEAHNGQVNVSIFGVDGRRMMSRTLENINGSTPFNINVENFAEGVYFIELITNQGAVSKKLVIQRN